MIIVAAEVPAKRGEKYWATRCPNTGKPLLLASRDTPRMAYQGFPCHHCQETHDVSLPMIYETISDGTEERP